MANPNKAKDVEIWDGTQWRSIVVHPLIPTVANKAALPATGNTKGDISVTEDTGTPYLWDGAKWVGGSAGGAGIEKWNATKQYKIGDVVFDAEGNMWMGHPLANPPIPVGIAPGTPGNNDQSASPYAYFWLPVTNPIIMPTEAQKNNYVSGREAGVLLVAQDTQALFVSDGAGVPVRIGGVTRTVTLAAGVAGDVQHDLQNENVIVQVFDSSKKVVDMEIQITDNTHVSLTATKAGTYTVRVMGIV